ncbi:uncharacterized protein LOC124797971 isoform X1 [Schistocerca piceifrons]|uniref:uncharacterized protein LOC124797971 isoform X1 n=1 Tax=Schistocerca piceifrons TaxID=274613 RepID=UPI001F5EF4D8|nr:uncharacterized protein LOC124797971 isoform X1 [Schistocerca piceifrons]
MNAQAWTDFFKEAGLGPDVAGSYGNIFFMNKIERSHLPYLNREVLGEMNISVLGHILMILKHARLVSDRVKSSTSAACFATPSESEDQISPTAGTRQNIEGSTSESDLQPEAQQSQLDSRGGSQSPKASSSFNKLDCEMGDSGVTESSVVKDCENESSEEAINSAVEVSQSEKSELSSQPVLAEKESPGKPTDSSGSNGVEEKDETNEQQSSLLPTPPMPHNWLDPSRKHFESDGPGDDGGGDKAASEVATNHEGQDGSNPDTAEREQENKSKILAYTQENEHERPPILPEKICSPLLPTPVMPENWLDPSRSSTDSSFTAFSDRGHTTPFFQSECVGDVPTSSFLPEANMNANMNLYDHFIPASDTANTDPLYPQASLFPNDNSQSQNNSTFDPYAEYNDQSMQERNFKAKSNPAWNKQMRQTQPYYRPQPQSAYGTSNYPSQPGFQNNAPGTLNMSSGYMYNTQPPNERREVHQWKY